jgi:hypothetical protein
MLQQMLRQLPSRTEMPDLIVDISQTALATGIPTSCSSPAGVAARSSTPRSRFPAHGGQLPPVRRLRQRRRLAAARGDHDHARHLAEARGREGAASSAERRLELSGTVKTYRYLDEEETASRRKRAAAQAGQGARMTCAHDSTDRPRSALALRVALLLRLRPRHHQHAGRRAQPREMDRGRARAPGAAARPAAGDAAVRDLRIRRAGMRDPFSNALGDDGSGARGRIRTAASRRSSSSRSTAWTWSARWAPGPGLVALVMAPDKVTYRVRPGAYMGQSDGRVTGVRTKTGSNLSNWCRMARAAGWNGRPRLRSKIND